MKPTYDIILDNIDFYKHIATSIIDKSEIYFTDDIEIMAHTGHDDCEAIYIHVDVNKTYVSIMQINDDFINVYLYSSDRKIIRFSQSILEEIIYYIDISHYKKWHIEGDMPSIFYRRRLITNEIIDLVFGNISPYSGGIVSWVVDNEYMKYNINYLINNDEYVDVCAKFDEIKNIYNLIEDNNNMKMYFKLKYGHLFS